MKIGLYIGRFQPFHLGHLSIVKRAINEVDFLVIGIGSAQYKNTKKNPLSFEERKKIIQKSLGGELKSNQYKIVKIEDIHNNEKWPEYVLKITGEIDVVFTGDKGIVKKLFEKYTQIKVKVFNEEIKIRATQIREKIKKGGSSWKNNVSPKAVETLTEINMKERIKNLED